MDLKYEKCVFCGTSSQLTTITSNESLKVYPWRKKASKIVVMCKYHKAKFETVVRKNTDPYRTVKDMIMFCQDKAQYQGW